MTPLINQLIEALREELKEYGEMLALLEEQQEHLMSRRADGVLETVERVNAQALVLKQTRGTRERTQTELAAAAGQEGCTSLLTLARHMPQGYEMLLEALVSENNQLLSRVQQRGRQNHLMLSRSLELMQRFISSLMPGQNATVYGGNGAVHSTPAGHALYEAVG